MSVSITHTQVPSVIAGANPYQVVDTVTATTNIAQEVFTFRVDTSAFDHVSSVADLQLYPTTRAAAVLAGKDFYRQSAVTYAAASIGTATTFAEEIRVALRVLANDYNTYLSDFAAGTVTETITNTN